MQWSRVTFWIVFHVVGASGRFAQDDGARLSPEPEALDRVLELEGIVSNADGSPATGARITASTGAEARTDPHGAYRLVTAAPLEALAIRVTARAEHDASTWASADVDLTAAWRHLAVEPLVLAAGGPCSPTWIPTFGSVPGVAGFPRVALQHDDGRGPALFVGGSFPSGGGGPAAPNIVRWDGTRWSEVGSGTDGYVWALAEFDDGSGTALYAGGAFTTAGGVAASHIARWDGSSWSPLGPGTDDEVRTLIVFDDGTGPALHAGGYFTSAGGVAANRVARWDGTSWSPLGSGIGGNVIGMTTFDEAGTTTLCVGGSFVDVGGQPASFVARWNGASWSAIAGPGGGLGGSVFTLLDAGPTLGLVAGGLFTTAEGDGALRVARWNGTSWSQLGAGLPGTVKGLTLLDAGTGPVLFAGGVGGVHRYENSDWVRVDGITGAHQEVFSLTTFDLGDGPRLCASTDSLEGNFRGPAVGDGTSWLPLGSGLNGSVQDLIEFDDGSGPALYVAGQFTGVGVGLVTSVARWDGSTWTALPSLGAVFDLEVFDRGNGPELYAAGHSIYRWTGSAWVSIDPSGNPQLARVLAAYDDGTGPALYVGGHLTSVGGSPTHGIARWKGGVWSSLGTGSLSFVTSLAVHDDGSGPALYVGGQIDHPALTSRYLSRWNGSTWSNFGPPFNRWPETLFVHDDGGGPALWAGGDFGIAGGTALPRIGKWNGTSWSAAGSGLNATVYALATHDDGSGPRLWAGGAFTTAGGLATSRMAAWDGSAWSPVPNGPSATVLALASHDDALFVGGEFRETPGHDSFLARRACDTTPPVLTCPPVIALEELGGTPGEVVTLSVGVEDDVDPAPAVSFSPASGGPFPPGTTLVTATATDAAGNQATCKFPVTVRPKARPARRP